MQSEYIPYIPRVSFSAELFIFICISSAEPSWLNFSVW